jgi:hypothetical protein
MRRNLERRSRTLFRLDVSLETEYSARWDLSFGMSPQRSDSIDRILKDSSGDVAKLMEMGITEFAIVTYVMRVRAGQSKNQALDALLEGRSLSERQTRFVRSVLQRFHID